MPKFHIFDVFFLFNPEAGMFQEQKDRFVTDVTQAKEIQKSASTELHEQSENAVNVENRQFLRENYELLLVICQYQASRRAGEQTRKRSAWNLSFSEFQILSLFLSCHFSEIYFPFCFGQMFHGFWTSNFDFYCLALQFSCIKVRLSEVSFLFAVASDQFQ